MLNDNIKKLRQQKGMTQEVLAEKLHVVRQTVSKWEKGLSVPDAEMLSKMAEVFEVSVSELLGEVAGFEQSEQEGGDRVAEQLALINEQLVIKNRRARRIWRTVAAILIGIGISIVGLLFLAKLLSCEPTEMRKEEEIVEEEYEFSKELNSTVELML